MRTRFLILLLIFFSSVSFAQTDTLRTASGLKYIIIAPGKGAFPVKGNKVYVNYTGTFKDGRIFDTSAIDGKPIKLTLGKGDFIPAWEEILLKMQVGMRVTLLVPSALGYGTKGLISDIAGEYKVPPNEDLVFEMELVKIKD